VIGDDLTLGIRPVLARERGDLVGDAVLQVVRPLFGVLEQGRTRMRMLVGGGRD
jgi:hypothetical protein